MDVMRDNLGSKQQVACVSAVEHELLDLTPQQLDILVDQEVHSHVPVYNIGGYVALKESVDYGVFARAYEREIARHDAFDLRIVKNGATLSQFARKERYPFDYRDFSHEAEPSESATAWLSTAFQRNFELNGEPLHFSGLIKIHEREYWYYSIAHHAIIDGWGYGLWIRGLVDRYLQEAGRKSGRDGPAGSFVEYLRDRRYGDSRTTGPTARWREVLGQWQGPALEPHEAGNTQPRRSVRVVRALDPELQTRIEEFAGQHGFRLHHVFVAALYLYFSRLRKRRDLMIGMPFHNRRGSDKGIVGQFVRMTPAFIVADQSADMIALLAAVKAAMGDVARRESVQMTELARWAAELGKPTRLFDLQFNYLKLNYETDSNITTESHYLTNSWSQVPFSLNVCDFGAHQPVEIQIDTNLAYFSAQEAELMFGRLVCQIEQAIADPSQALAKFELISPPEKRQLVEQLGRGEALSDPTLGIAGSFSQACRLTPDAVAIRSHGGCLSYGELDRQSECLAQQLERRAPGSQAPIALCMTRAPWLIVAMLAAAKLRRAYLPLDMTMPSARLRYMVEDAGPDVVLTDDAGRAASDPFGLDTINVEQALQSDCWRSARPAAVCDETTWTTLAQRPACIMYTSGSTGQPKGVLVPQSGIVRLAKMCDYMPLDQGTVMLHLSNASFDASSLEIWGPLLNGGVVALHPPGMTDLSTLTATIEDLGVNTMWLTAGLFEKWATHTARVPASLKYLLAGGDVVSPAAAQRVTALKPDLVVINGYGPTENSTFSTCWRSDAGIDPREPLPIGRPIRGSTAYVVDGDGCLLPRGERGELWVGGHGVATGYLNEPELTAERFVSDVDFAPGERIYKTGDQVRWRSDGLLEYLGRLDRQVKLNGFRVEIGEIENHLRAHPRVRAAAVTVAARSAGDKVLTAHVCIEQDADRRNFPAELADFAGERLPAYMVPARIVIRDELPLNANGKVDRATLAKQVEEPGLAEPALAAEGPAAQLQAIWESVLHRRVESPDQSFFDCGGHSLAAMEVLARIEDEMQVVIPIGEFFANATVRQQVRCIERERAARELPATSLVAHGDIAESPLSFTQESMWLAQRMGQGDHLYNVPGVFKLVGRIDRHALAKAFRAVMRRHRPLASIVVERDGETILVARDPARFDVQYDSIADLPEAQRAARVEAEATDERNRAFDLGRDYPIRARLLVTGDTESYLLLTLHHIAVDGLSLENLFSELARFYTAAAGGSTAEAGPLEFQHHDFVLHQRQWASSPAADQARAYWCRYMQDAPAEHKLPLDFARPPVPSYRGAVIRSRIGSAATARLREQAGQAGISLYSLLSSAFGVLAGEYSNERDIVVGTPVHGRVTPKLNRNIGCFINTLLLRTRYDFAQTLLDVAQQRQAEWLEHLQHEQLPYALMLKALDAPQNRSVNSVFQLWFVLHSRSADALALDGVEAELVQFDRATTKFDIMLAVTEHDDGLELEWIYAEDIFASNTMQTLLDAYCSLLERIDDVSAAPIATLPGRLDFAGTQLTTPMAKQYDASQSLPARVLEHARTSPEAPALVHGSCTVSYEALADRVARLAGLLVDAGVEAGDCVGVCADRTVGGVVAMLAVQSVGAAYLPIDAALPRERLEFMVSDAQVSVMLATSEFAVHDTLANLDIVYLDDVVDSSWLSGQAVHRPRAAAGDADSTAYVIYTSGSSGQPKGVRVSRANVAHYVAAMVERHDFSECRNFGVSSAFHTDLGNTTLYIGLWQGGCLHLMDSLMMLDGRTFARYVDEHDIDVLKMVPGHFSSLCDGASWAPPVPRKLLLFGGESLRASVLRQIRHDCRRRGCRVINHYGPTEATIGSLTHEIDLDRIPDVVPIGLPLPGESAMIVNGKLPVPHGAWGELLIGGPGVARGYLGRVELDRQAFVTDVAGAGRPQRWYRTGDRVRIDASGRIVFGGRLDDQIKIRGFRVELDEIDSHILALNEVSAAKTVVHGEPDGQPELVSCVTPIDVCTDDIRRRLIKALPEHMIPGTIFAVDALPLLGNGKICRRTLAQIVERGAAGGAGPQTPTESRLHTILSGLLGRPDVPVNVGFFDAGGNSLMLTRLTNELSREMDVRLPVNLLMENPTIQQMATLVDALGAPAPSAVRDTGMVEVDV